MDILIAIAHILGSIIVFMVHAFALLFIEGWEKNRKRNKFMEEASVTLGVSVDNLEKEENIRKLFKLYSERFSSELFRNRISDLCGLIILVLAWLTNIVQAVVLIAVLWFTVAASIENAVYAWIIPGMSIVTWLTSIVFSLACQLFTGRSPGQAKEARKQLAKWVKDSGEVLSTTH